MNELITTDKFTEWLLVKGYVDADGVLSVKMREAEALFLSEDIQSHRQDIEESFVAIAKSLWQIYKNQYWIELGYSNFKELLCSPEIDLAPSTSYGYSTIGRLIEEGKINEQDVLDIGASKARTLLPVIADEDDKEVVEEWFAKAGELTTLDLMDEVKGKPIDRYSGSGKLDDLLDELRIKGQGREVFWTERVNLHIRTV